MYIEEPKKNKNGELISHVYLTEEEAGLLDEEDKKKLEPCNITIEPYYTATYQFKLPEGAENEGIKNLSNEEIFKVLADMVTETKWEPIDSLEELKESIEKQYDKKNIAIL